jgi:tetratricopeptide (TPR) repeat protein
MQFSFVVVLTVATCGQAEPATGESASAEQIEQTIQQLGDADAEVSNRAYQYLWKAGRPAEAAIAKAVKNNNPAIATRAKLLHENLSYGIYHDTSASVLDLIYEFRDGDESTKRSAIGQLIGRNQLHTVWKLLKKSGRSDEQLLLEYSSLVRRYLPLMIAEDRLSEVGKLLEAKVSSEQHFRDGVRDYAAYLLHRGYLEPEIRLLKRKTSPEDRRLLAYLLLFSGDLKSASNVAKQIGDAQLQVELFHRTRDWKSLLNGGHVPAAPPSLEWHGFLAAFARLSGDAKAFDRAINQIISLNVPKGVAHQKAEALMLNDRWQDAVHVLRESGQVNVAFELLLKRSQAAEAFAAFGFDLEEDDVNDWLSQQSTDADKLDKGFRVAEALLKFGDHKRATTLLDGIEAMATKDRIAVQYRIATTEYKAGLRERALKRLVQADKAQERLSIFFYSLLRKREVTPSFVLFCEQELRKANPGWDESQCVQGLHRLFVPKLDPAASAKVLDSLLKLWDQKHVTDSRQHRHLLMYAGELCVIHGRKQQAAVNFLKYFDQSPPSGMALRIADLFKEAKNWNEATRFYRRAWEVDPSSAGPAALFLHGYALKQAGYKDQGEKPMQRASMIPLGDVAARSRLAKMLHERGLKEEAARQWDMILQLGSHSAWEGGQATAVMDASRLTGDRLAVSDPERAADHWQRMALYQLKSNYFMLETTGYAHSMFLIHKSRARGLLKRGKVEEALREVWLCHAAAPGDTTAAIDLVPLLDKAGRKDEADKLFSTIYLIDEEVCRLFPGASEYHNDMAWMCANCKRRLDDALVHARRAVELDPQRAAFVDTLAFLHFCRGEKDDAIALARKCIELEPDNEHFKRQLERFQKGE